MIRTLRPSIAPVDVRTLRPAPAFGASIYADPRWVALMADIIGKRGRRCEDPGHDPARSMSGKIYGDHIHELKDGGAPFDEANVMLRCASCHTRKTVAERERRLAR